MKFGELVERNTKNYSQTTFYKIKIEHISGLIV